jgi:hypothetical protein
VTGDHRQTAEGWHGGQSTALYAYASTGTIAAGLDDEIQACLAIVEHADEASDLDRVGEHERLRALLHHVEPQLVATRAGDGPASRTLAAGGIRCVPAPPHR